MQSASTTPARKERPPPLARSSKSYSGGRSGDGFTARDILRHGWAHLNDREQIELGLILLGDLGLRRRPGADRKAAGWATKGHLRDQPLGAKMNRYLAKLQQIDPEAKQADGFVGFVSAPSSRNSEFQNSRNATDVNRQNCQNPYGRVFEGLRSGCPALVEVERWQKTVRDAESFLATWGGQAYALGWTARNYSACIPFRRSRRPRFDE